MHSPHQSIGNATITNFLAELQYDFRPSSSEITIRVCPFCSGDTSKSDNQFKLSVNAESGLYQCFRCGSKGNWNSFLKYHNAGGREQVPVTSLNAKADTESKVESAGKIWSKALPLSHPTSNRGVVYLETRGIPNPSEIGEVRFCPSLYHSDSMKEYPCLVLRVSDLNGVGTGIQRIFLNEAGAKLTGGAKKALGSISGGAIKFDKAGTVLHLAEGPETALSIRAALCEPTWSAISAHGLEKIQIPDQTKIVFIWADLDRSLTGQRSANVLRERLIQEGKLAHVLTPDGKIPEGEKGIDFNDVLRKEGLNDIKKYILEATLSPASPIAVPAQEKKWPIPIKEDGFIGPLGKLVTALEPHTEADAAALLFQSIAAFGNIIGRCAYYMVEDTKHHTNLFGVLVGNSSSARKGTSWGRVKRIFGEVDKEWTKNHVVSGLVSGEGVIHHVRDPEVDEANNVVKPGIDDKRILVQEGEFVQVLKVGKREGNTLSVTLRNVWDDGNVSNFSKQSPERASGAHISIVGHITRAELEKHLTGVETANGFGNRFLWVCVKRARLLPEGGKPESKVLEPIIQELRETVSYCKQLRTQISWSAEARVKWHAEYPNLTKELPGIFGMMVARSAPQVIRLSLIFALSERSNEITERHLNAALAVWRFCEDSASYLFGSKLGDEHSDRLLSALENAPNGLTQTDLHKVFQKNLKGTSLQDLTNRLIATHLVEWRSDRLFKK